MIAACPEYCKRPKLLQILAVVALIFGAASVFSGGQIIFGPEEKRLAAGDVVPFVLWFNFVAGFAYMAAAVGLFWRQKWGARLAVGIALATAPAATLPAVSRALERSSTSLASSSEYLSTPDRSAWPGRSCVTGS